METVRIGTIGNESGREGVYWTGYSICNARGRDIAIGTARTRDDAIALARHLAELTDQEFTEE